MTQQVNEFGVLSVSTVPPISYDISMPDPAVQADAAEVPSAPVPVPVQEVVSVYVVSAEATNGYADAGDDSVTIDLVLNVGINGTGCYSTHKVVKRLCMSRAKLAAEAKNCEVICVEEKLSEEQQVVKRLRDMIGH